MNIRLGLGLALYTLVATSHCPGQHAASITTDDGFLLGLAPDGKVATIRLDGREVPLAARPALLQVRDAATNSSFQPVTGTIEKQGKDVDLISETTPLGLKLSAHISAQGNFLQVDGDVVDSTGHDRCIDLKVCLPIERKGFVREEGLADRAVVVPAKKKKSKKEAPRQPDGEIDESAPEDNALYPLCPVNNANARAGLSLAVPPTHPTRFVTGLDGSGAYVLVRIGLSPASAKPGHTPFRVIMYRHEPEWGFRASLARYYEFYRADFFTRRVKKIGAWTSQNASKLKNPQLYAYHEAGFPTWKHPAGTDSGVNVKLTLEHLDEGPICNSLSEYERLCELALDKKHGIYSLPYTIVGQRQFLQLPSLPQNFEQAMDVLRSWSTTRPILFDGPPQAVSFRSAEELKTIIRNSTIHDQEHRLQWLARPYRGPTLAFPQNPAPNLFSDTNRLTIAKYTLDYYLPMMFQSEYVDGCYLDSLGRWCGFHNYRAEHFKYATVPLTYAGSPPQPCLWNLQSHAEYLWEMGKRLHAQGKIFIANGVHPNRMMLGFACDVMGGEGAPAYTSGEGFYALRAAASIKPYCLLNATHKVSPRLWNSCLYMGYLMGANSPAGWADEAKYLPAVIKINEAGWQPVTHARTTPAVVGIERWGGQDPTSPLFFTVMNRSSEEANAEITVDLAALKGRGDVNARGLPVELPITLERKAGQLVIRCKLGPEQATAIQMQ